MRKENSDRLDSAVYLKKQEKALPDLYKVQKNYAKFTGKNSSNKNEVQDSPNNGDDIIVPEVSQNEDNKESLSPRGEKYNLRPIPNPNYSEDFRY